MTLFTFYTLFCLQILQRVIIIGGERSLHDTLTDTSCVINSCGTRDETGIVTICEDTEIGDECPYLESVTASSNSDSNSYTSFCEETNGESCKSQSDSATRKAISSHKETVHTTGENNSPNSNKETVDTTGENNSPNSNKETGDTTGENNSPNSDKETEDATGENNSPNSDKETGDTAGEKHSINSDKETEDTSGEKHSPNSDAFSSYNYEIRAQLLAKLLELMAKRSPTVWPRPTDYFLTAEDTLYHVTIKEDCSGERVSYNDNKYLPVRIKINQQMKQIDSKISSSEEQHRRLRKRYSPRHTKRRFRQAEDQENLQHNHIDEQDKETLQHVYGKKTYSEHESDFEQVGQMGQQDNGDIEHKLSHVNNPTNDKMDDVIDEARMNAVNEDNNISSEKDNHDAQLDSGLVKNMLKDLLQKLDEIEHDSKRKSTSHGHCNIHGMWLSTVAGAAIELLPDNNGVINTKIVDLPQPPEGALINAQWTGTGMISKESPTTITIVFQEHIPHNENDNSAHPPRTAVFVGQCLVCDNSPMLQGTWILFPNSQNCFPLSDKRNSPSSDIMYRIRR